MGHTSVLSTYNKLLYYKQIIKPAWSVQVYKAPVMYRLLNAFR